MIGVISMPAVDRQYLVVGMICSFQKRQGMSIMDAAKEAVSFADFNEKTVRLYKELYENNGRFNETKQGKYKQVSLLNDENLRLEAAMFIREHSYKKGSLNLTARMFCEWETNTFCHPMTCRQACPEESL